MVDFVKGFHQILKKAQQQPRSEFFVIRACIFFITAGSKAKLIFVNDNESAEDWYHPWEHGLFPFLKPSSNFRIFYDVSVNAC